jgi:superfamily II DNA/RNA helicase
MLRVPDINYDIPWNPTRLIQRVGRVNRVDTKFDVIHTYAPHVRSCARLGTYEAPDGELADVLIVHTTEPWKLERTRTALRDFVAHKFQPCGKSSVRR